MSDGCLYNFFVWRLIFVWKEVPPSVPSKVLAILQISKWLRAASAELVPRLLRIAWEFALEPSLGRVRCLRPSLAMPSPSLLRLVVRKRISDARKLFPNINFHLPRSLCFLIRRRSQSNSLFILAQGSIPSRVSKLGCSILAVFC